MDDFLLPDGRQVTIRPIREDDHDRLRDHHARLSPESRYRRFLASKPELTEADARYLVQVDGHDHFALVAAAAGEPEQPLVGVARYIRIPNEPEAAEFAVVVVDDYQGQGLAGELMARLADVAVAHGINRFRATMLVDNVAIHRVAEKLAAGPVRRWTSGSVAEIELELAAAQPAAVLPFPPRPVADADGTTPAIIGACAGG